MIADLEIYLERDVEEFLPQLIDPPAPFTLERAYPSFYILRARDSVLNGPFIYSETDQDMLEDPLHPEAQKTLGFQPRSNLHYEKCNLNPQKASAFINISQYLSAQHIPHYMTVINEIGEEAVVRGHNPSTGVRIHNSRFQQDSLTELVE